MAASVGFEPTERNPPFAAFPRQCLKPLGHDAIVMRLVIVEDRVGFEPTEAEAPPDFESGTLSHSATYPYWRKVESTIPILSPGPTV